MLGERKVIYKIDWKHHAETEIRNPETNISFCTEKPKNQRLPGKQFIANDEPNGARVAHRDGFFNTLSMASVSNFEYKKRQ